MNVFEEFEWRGLIYDASEGLKEALAGQKITGYIGFDPTAPSLHVGSLLPIMGLVRLQQYGHTPVALMGGGTGMIGDPSGKTEERQLLSKEQIEYNLEGIRAQLSRFLDFEARTNKALLVNNADWLVPVSMVDFLRDVGKHFTVSYMLLQAYDFLVLHDRYGCTLQMGGSDQWGNIVAGIELIRKLRGTRCYALVSPLVTTSAGIKFGKTEAGSVWRDANLTSPYRFYQFWYN